MDAKKRAGFGRKKPKAMRSSEVKPVMPKPRVAPKPKAKAPPPGQIRRQDAPGQRKKALGLRNASSIAPGGQKRLAGGGLRQSLPPRPLGNPTVGGRAVIGTRPRPQPVAVGDPAVAFGSPTATGPFPLRKPGPSATNTPVAPSGGTYNVGFKTPSK